MTSQFEIIVDLTNKKIEKTIRGTIFEISERIMFRSPVGDPKYWLSLNPYTSLSGGKPRHKTMKKAPVGYVGGAFRANWQYGFNQRPSGEVAGTDKSGSATLGKIKSGINSSPAYGIHYLVNNLPYSIRLENGWSRQAPHGMVKLTALEFGSIVSQENKK